MILYHGSNVEVREKLKDRFTFKTEKAISLLNCTEVRSV